MAKKIIISVSGESEKFLNRMIANYEMSEGEIFALALGLLKEAVEDKVVAKVKPFNEYDLVKESFTDSSPNYYVLPKIKNNVK